MNSKRKASKIKHMCSGLNDQAAAQIEKHKRKSQKERRKKRNKYIGLFPLISSYVIWLKNICLQVRAPPVRKRLLKTLHGSLLH